MSGADLIKLFFISEAIWLVGLGISMKITGVSFTFPRLLLIATVPTVAVVLPIHFLLKLVLSTVLTYILIVKLTDAEFFPDGVLVVGVANVLYVMIGLTLITKLG